MAKNLLTRTANVLGGLWRLLDATRRALLNLLLLLVLAGLAWLLWQRAPAPPKEKSTLVLQLSGDLVEQYSAGSRASALRSLGGQGPAQTRVRDVVDALDEAARDEHITQALLMLDDLGSAGMASLNEVAGAVDRFKTSGKKVVAWGSEFDQRQYLLAARASEIWMHPMGVVYLRGLGGHRSYYKDALDRLGISANVVRVGQFKNAAEPFSASAPSEQTLTSDRAWLGSLWSQWTASVEKARQLPAGAVMAYIDGLPTTLPAAGGDAAKLALQAKLVDALKTRDEMRELLAERGARDEKNKTFRQVSLGDFLDRIDAPRGGDAVGVIVAQGAIVDGRAAAGRVGGLSTAELVRKAREDDKIKALVLRVNSPGGSAFGSELVRHELELARKAGKPVVVSMGDVAASGGYWISMAADEVIADGATITGSIGVVAMLPTAKGTLDKLGVNTGGTTTAWLAGAYDPRRDVDPRFVALLQSAVGHVYGDFIGHVSTQRKLTREQVEALAQGRVWSGEQAQAQGLVDRLGGFADAVKAAAVRAKLGDKPRLRYLEVEPGRLQRLLRRFGLSAAAWLGIEADLPWATAAIGALPEPLQTLAEGAAADLGGLGEVIAGRRPFATVTHCLCEWPW